MLTRLSNITSFQYGAHNSGMGFNLAHTDIVFHFHDAYYLSRISGHHLTMLDLEVEEERFLERRMRRH